MPRIPTDSDNDNAVHPVSSPDIAARRLSSGQRISVMVTTGSMRPTIQPGEVIEVRPGVSSIGDVILVRATVDGEPRLILHRLLLRVPLFGKGRVIHVGDQPGARPYIATEGDVIGIADLPRLPISREWWKRLVDSSRELLERRMRR